MHYSSFEKSRWRRGLLFLVFLVFVVVSLFVPAVAAANNAPTLVQPGDRAAVQSTTVIHRLLASDPDFDSITFSSPNLPIGAQLDAATGTFTWAVGQAALGPYQITVVAAMVL